MRASILSFASYRLRREGAPASRQRNWSQQELAELYRVRDRLVQTGLRVALDLGLTDEGDPWAVFVQSETGDPFVHIARLEDVIVVANMLANVVYRGEDFRSITDQMLRDAPLVLTPAKAGEAKVLLHPRSVFTAFVAAAVVLAEFVRSIEPSRAATDQEKAAQDKAVAETKALYPMILDRILARDAGWTAPIATAGAAASLMAAAVGAVFMTENGAADDAPIVLAGLRDQAVAEQALAAADGPQGRVEKANATETLAEAPTAAAAQWSEMRRPTPEPAARPEESRPSAVETSPVAESKPLADAPSHPTPSVSEIAGVQSSKTAAAPASDLPTQQAAPPQAQPASNSDAQHAKDLAVIMDSVIVVRLPQGANDKMISQAIDRALEPSPSGVGHAGAGSKDAAAGTDIADSRAGAESSRDWVLHTDAANGFLGTMRDGSHDVVLISGQNVTVVNFRFNEDYLLYNGELDTTSWIKSIDIKGDDVTIVATDGSVVSLIDTHGLIA